MLKKLSKKEQEKINAQIKAALEKGKRDREAVEEIYKYGQKFGGTQYYA